MPSMTRSAFRARTLPGTPTCASLLDESKLKSGRRKSKKSAKRMAAARMQAAATRFFRSQYFAVAGASQDTDKYGYKVFNWYNAHALPVTPLNPNTPSITLPAYPDPLSPRTSALSPSSETVIHHTVPSPLSLPEPAQTSLSIITPPAVTKKLLREAHTAGIRAVWLQPGSFDDEGIEYARRTFESAVGGDGWCVLVNGEGAMRRARKEREEEEKETDKGRL